jgi:glutamyl/glutaminyl-tRNA synthetase
MKLAGWPRVGEILAAVTELLKTAEPFTPEALEAAFRAKSGQMGLKFKDLVHPTRFATTGRTAGPSLFHLLAVLGRDRCIQRLAAALTHPK